MLLISPPNIDITTTYQPTINKNAVALLLNVVKQQQHLNKPDR